MFARTFSRFRSTSVTKDISDIGKTLSRMKVVEKTKDCAEITDKINAKESPIGVDAEGINQGKTNSLGMIQVGTENGDIFLFRTGVNPRLINEGGLKKIMENHKVLKIMHDATGKVFTNLEF